MLHAGRFGPPGERLTWINAAWAEQQPVAGRRARGEDVPVPSSPRRTLSADDVAAWLVKTSLPPEELVDGWPPGDTRRLQRCLRASYRLDLMRAGQPCLLWLSGRDRPGVHAVGTIAGSPTTGVGGPEVPVTLRRLRRPVPRDLLLRSPAFAGAEVVRMPAGSNPSYLTAAQLSAVRDLLDEPYST
jgi:hypothetical protein